MNKLWNAARFILSNAGPAELPEAIDPGKLDIGSRWIVSRLSAAIDEINGSLGDYRFNDAASSIYQFTWQELCDWYIEMVKPVLYSEAEEKRQVQECLLFVLDRTLRLLHPFMPFVTEEIWQNIPKVRGQETSESIMVAGYPSPLLLDERAEKEMAVLMETASPATLRTGTCPSRVRPARSETGASRRCSAAWSCSTRGAGRWRSAPATIGWS